MIGEQAASGEEEIMGGMLALGDWSAKSECVVWWVQSVEIAAVGLGGIKHAGDLEMGGRPRVGASALCHYGGKNILTLLFDTKNGAVGEKSC